MHTPLLFPFKTGSLIINNNHTKRFPAAIIVTLFFEYVTHVMNCTGLVNLQLPCFSFIFLCEICRMICVFSTGRAMNVQFQLNWHLHKAKINVRSLHYYVINYLVGRIDCTKSSFQEKKTTAFTIFLISVEKSQWCLGVNFTSSRVANAISYRKHQLTALSNLSKWFSKSYDNKLSHSVWYHTFHI